MGGVDARPISRAASLGDWRPRRFILGVFGWRKSRCCLGGRFLEESAADSINTLLGHVTEPRFFLSSFPPIAGNRQKPSTLKIRVKWRLSI
jgi:hypothetical protein